MTILQIWWLREALERYFQRYNAVKRQKEQEETDVEFMGNIELFLHIRRLMCEMRHCNNASFREI